MIRNEGVLYICVFFMHRFFFKHAADALAVRDSWSHGGTRNGCSTCDQWLCDSRPKSGQTHLRAKGMGLIVGSGMSQISQDRQSPYSSRHIYRAMPIKFSVKVRGMVLKNRTVVGETFLLWEMTGTEVLWVITFEGFENLMAPMDLLLQTMYIHINFCTFLGGPQIPWSPSIDFWTIK